jgi:uncharacterized protein
VGVGLTSERTRWRTPLAAADLADLSTRFCDLLRLAGLPVGPEHVARLTRAVLLLNPSTDRELRLMMHSTLTTGLREQRVLDALFDQVFGGLIDDFTRGDGSAPPVPTGIEPGATPPSSSAAQSASEGQGPRKGGGSSASTDSDASDREAETVQMTASIEERLGHKDFAACSSEELLQLAELISGLTLHPPPRRSHRRHPARNGSHVDLRRTLRLSRRTGGHVLKLYRKAPSIQTRNVVLIADISGSMEQYTRAYLYLLHATVSALKAEAFLFSTRLTRATTVLRHHSPEVALHQASKAAKDWSGGTRIGAAVQEFLDGWGRRGLARGSVIVIISDGWEAGDPALLGEQMARLSRLAHRVVWVNPRKQAIGYQPLVAGMAAALPSIDTFISGHSFVSLREVAAAIAAP